MGGIDLPWLAISTTELAEQMVFMQSLMVQRKWEAIDTALVNIDVMETSNELLLAWLRTTFPVRRYLTQWIMFRDNVTLYFDEYDVNASLNGLF